MKEKILKLLKSSNLKAFTWWSMHEPSKPQLMK